MCRNPECHGCATRATWTTVTVSAEFPGIAASNPGIITALARYDAAVAECGADAMHHPPIFPQRLRDRMTLTP